MTKGREDAPGEIRGFSEEYNEIGEIKVNSKNGIYGEVDDKVNGKKVAVASKNEIELGNAKILCTVDESQTVKEYDIEIQKISASNFSGSKGMVVKVVDEELIGKTGGIVQGMSGSPIIQNGKFIGAVTHVTV